MSLEEKAYQSIKRKLLSLELDPAVPINETALVREFGLGRSFVQEALRRLADEGLVVDRGRRGLFVADLVTTRLLRQVVELRTVLEGFCARLAVERATDEQLAHMEELLDHFQTILERGDNQALMAVDQKFHKVLYQAADNEFLEETLDHLYGLSLRLWYFSLDKLGGLRGIVEKHREIVEALKQRDARQAEKLLRQHIAEFEQEIEAVI